MKKKVLNLLPIAVIGIVVGILMTALVYFRFPQYLCYAVYDVKASDLYQKSNREMVPGTTLTEYFTPVNDYLTAVRIHVEREGIEDADNVVKGSLYDAKQKLLGEAYFSPGDEYFEFKFNEWVDTEETYRLEIVFPEENETSIMTTFGPADIGPAEHRDIYIDDQPTDRALYTEYVYGTYSKKLLVFWFIIFFLGGIMIGDAILCSKTK